MKIRISARRIRSGIVCALIIASAAATAWGADIEGTVIKNDGGRLAGTIRYLGSSKEFMVTSRGVSLRVPLDQVARVETPPPPALEEAARAVRGGQYAAAIPALETVMKDYRMMQHDITAAGYLAGAYLGMDQADKSLEMCRRIMNDNPEAAVSGDLAPVYWEALRRTGQDATLEKALSEAIEKSSRQMAARAQIMRGDILARNGKHREALVDGYLRTAVMYRDVKEAQPEALYKAAQSFDQLEEHAHAEKMRKELLAKYPNDQYSRRLREGTPGA